MYNKMTLKFHSLSENESFARNAVASFVLPLNPTVSELNDVKTAVSEAVTNAIVHGYPDGVGEIIIESETEEDSLHINIRDFGVGIENLENALSPNYTTKPEVERSGMGFTIMKTFMDCVEVESELNKGTTVKMIKNFNRRKAE